MTKRLPKISLRLLLLAVTLFAVWLSWHVQNSKLQRRAVETITNYGGWVRYDFQVRSGSFDPKVKSRVPSFVLEALGYDFFHSVVEVNLVYSDDTGKRFENAAADAAPLDVLPNLKRLKLLCLRGGQSNDVNLKHVGDLRRLQSLYLYDANHVSDIGISYLKGLQQLRNIHVENSQITDDALAVFASFPKLETLCLQGSTLTDEGVANLRSLDRLRVLWVCGKMDSQNDITDESLEFITDLPYFELLGVQRTRVSSNFEQQVVGRFPKCKVIR